MFAGRDDEPSDPESNRKKPFDPDAFWPSIPGGTWPEGFTVSREQIYDDAGRLTGGPQEEPGDSSE